MFIYTCRYSILLALSLDGILSLDIVEGSFDQNSFAQFIDSLLDQMNPFPAKNCRIHHADFILQMILNRYAFISFQSRLFSEIYLEE